MAQFPNWQTRAQQLLRLLICLALGSCVKAPQHQGVYPVGVTTAAFLDPTSQKPLTVEVWYPAPDAIVESQQFYARAFPGLAARDVPVRPGAKYPLVVLSHGQHSGRYDLAWLAEGLAADGYVVAAVDHPGSLSTDYDAAEAPKLWVRAHHLSIVIDGLLHSEHFATSIDPRRIAAGGHSAGGSSVMVLAGARIDAALYAAFFPEVKDIPEVAYDRRVRAIMTLAPGTGRVFTTTGVAHVTVPTLIISGQNDGQAPEPKNAAFFAHNVADPEWHSMPNVGHYVFAPTCSLYGTLRSRAVCHDAWGVDRDQIHQQVLDWVRAFLRRNLL